VVENLPCTTITEDAQYEPAALRRFAGIEMGRAPVPDETTIRNFCHLLEKHDLDRSMLQVSCEAPLRQEMTEGFMFFTTFSSPPWREERHGATCRQLQD